MTLARTRTLLAVAAATVLGAGSTLLFGVSSTGPSSSCARVAATSGSDANAGSVDAPFKTAGKLVTSLSNGQTGCLRAGVYQQDISIATPGVTLTSFQGERATLTGRLWVKQGANGVVVTGLNLNGKNAALLPSPTVNGDDDQFVGDDVTNDHTEICFLIGSSYGRAHRTIIRGNRIHDCGKLPSQNQDHGVYIGSADDTQVLDNVIVHNVDRGVQLYPDAQRTVVRGNVIDSNGEGIIFAGVGALASSGSIVTANAITGSQIRHDVESYWGGTAIGSNNTVTGNCIFGGKQGTIGAQTGFAATANTLADPGYLDPAAGDYRIPASSPCAQVLKTSSAPAGPHGEPPLIAPPTPAPTPTTSTTPPPTVPTTPVPVPSWQPSTGARVKITKASSAQYGHAGEIVYLSTDRQRAILLMDDATVKPVLMRDVGQA